MFHDFHDKNGRSSTTVVRSETEVVINDRAFYIGYFSCFPFDSILNIL